VTPLDFQYGGSFQRGTIFSAENPLEEVWAQLSRIGTPEYSSSLVPNRPGIDWAKHSEYASVRIRQGIELRRSSRSASLLTGPIFLYYSFLNLLRACMAILPEVLGAERHGLSYKSNPDLLSNEAKILPGTFSEYLDTTSTTWTRGTTLSLKSCLSRIPEVAGEFKSPHRGELMVVKVSIQAMTRAKTVTLNFDDRWVDEAQFRSNWSIDYPSLKDSCELEERGTSLRVRPEYRPEDYDGVCRFCEERLLNSLVFSSRPDWYALRHEKDHSSLPRAGYYFVAVFILGSIARYRPELIQKALAPGTELEWFINRFMWKAERFFPQLMFSWLYKGQTYFQND